MDEEMMDDDLDTLEKLFGSEPLPTVTGDDQSATEWEQARPRGSQTLAA
jgi:hypothetical protein